MGPPQSGVWLSVHEMRAVGIRNKKTAEAVFLFHTLRLRF